MGIDRREALWAVRALDAGSAAERLPLFERPALVLRDHEPATRLPSMPLGEHVIHDYRTLSLSLKAHPVSFLREKLDGARVLRNGLLKDVPSGRFVSVAGLVLVRQRPGSAKGVIFMTIEDETGIANIIVWKKTFERFRAIVLGARFVRVQGKLQSESGVIHVVASKIEDVTPWLGDLSEEASRIRTLANADEVGRQGHDHRAKASRILPPSRLQHSGSNDPPHHETASVMPRGRNFH
jgi:error-prone DNA polymerase